MRTAFMPGYAAGPRYLSVRCHPSIVLINRVAVTGAGTDADRSQIAHIQAAPLRPVASSSERSWCTKFGGRDAVTRSSTKRFTRTPGRARVCNAYLVLMGAFVTRLANRKPPHRLLTLPWMSLSISEASGTH